MTREEVRARIEEIGIIPIVRVSTAEEAFFAAEAVACGGIPIVEVAMTVEGAAGVISQLVRNAPPMIVGAGSVLDAEMARVCVGAGARFLTSEGFDAEVVEFAGEQGVVVLPGGGDHSVEGLRRLREGLSLRGNGRRKLYPCPEGGFTSGAHDRGGGHNSIDGRQFDPGGCCRAGHWTGVDPQRRHQTAQGGMGL